MSVLMEGMVELVMQKTKTILKKTGLVTKKRARSTPTARTSLKEVIQWLIRAQWLWQEHPGSTVAKVSVIVLNNRHLVNQLIW